MTQYFASNWFQLLKRLRQGCPLSAYLFLLCIEVLANRIRQNKDIRGISIGSKEQKLSLFADDCTGIIKDQSSILKLLEEIDRYTKYSGLRLNAQKSEIYVIKDSKTQIAREIPLKILKDDIRLLGITIGRNVYQQEQDNIETKITSREKTFNRWSQDN